jgi:hypothetical protein
MKWRRRPRHTKIVLLLALVAVGMPALTGCGQSSRATASPATASTSTSKSPADAQLIARADAICKRLSDEIKATLPGKRDSNLELGRNALQHAALERKAASTLGKLTPPPSLAHDWAQILAYSRRLSSGLVTLSRYWKLDEKQGISAVAASKNQIHLKLSALASRDGFKDCSHI